MTQLDVNTEYLKSIVKTHGALDLNHLCFVVLDDPNFSLSPGGSEHHHNYPGGLAKHVREVMENVLKLTQCRPSQVLLVSVIYHDYMKIRDYSLSEQGEVIKNRYRKLVNHVSGSFAEFYHQCKVHQITNMEFIDEVSHCLLSHHGRREWGSPVEPLTSDALILHCADMMSSRGVNIHV